MKRNTNTKEGEIWTEIRIERKNITIKMREKIIRINYKIRIKKP